MTNLRAAIVGLGDIARKVYLPLLAVWDGLELMLCSRTPATVERLQAQYRLSRGTADLDEVLRWEPEAAFVLTPSPTHKAIAMRLLQSGVDVLVEKTRRATEEFQVKEVLLAGGVASNALLRERMVARVKVPVRYPPPILCTDNAAMVASAGYFKHMAGERAGWDLDVQPGMCLRCEP